MVTSHQILNAKKCGDIFSFTDSVDEIKKEYISLIKQYHPDIYKEKDADKIAMKINELYNRALELIKLKTWESTNKVIVSAKTGKKIIMNFLSESDFELGKFYIGKKHLIYLLDSKHKKFYDNALKTISKIKYENDKMKKEFERYFPIVEENFETIDGKWCIILQKTEDVFLLSDLIKQQNGRIPIKHVAWIVSRLSNISCFLQYNKIVHNGISIDNCFVSPSHHSILLLGGWWYSVPENEKMIGTQKVIYNIMPLKDKESKKASHRTDLESIKLIGKIILNNLSMITKKDTTNEIPISIQEWFKKGSSNNSFEEFSKWNIALDQAWGERKFIELNVSEKDIYKL